MVTDVEGVLVGHWTDDEAQTGCTVVRFPDGTTASGEVRGGAPATYDFSLLEPGRLVDRIDAVVLSGGSAFGLAAATGVAAELEADGVGFPTAAGPVPIVVGMCLYDLGVGDGSVRPTAESGRMAARSASAEPVLPSRLGAGAGATVGKWRGADQARPAGLGVASTTIGDVVVACIVGVNASGDIDDGSLGAAVRSNTFEPPVVEAFENTTIALVVTNAMLSKLDCHGVSQRAHDGFGRALAPAHMAGDGDAIVVAATGAVECEPTTVSAVVPHVVEAAVRSVTTLD